MKKVYLKEELKELRGGCAYSRKYCRYRSDKKYILSGLMEEYTDVIECSEGVNYTFSLFLLLSDYAVVVIKKELSKFLLE